MKQIFIGLMSLIIGNTTIMSLTNILNQQQKSEYSKAATNIKQDINYSWENTHNNWTYDSSNTYKLFDWYSDETPTFNSFQSIYPTFTIDGTMHCGSVGVGEYVSTRYSAPTSFIE